jgi:molecular chaperone HtpG
LNHHFQVNLHGIIDLLSHHLYSGPEVCVRELLQNAVDAIRAREEIEPDCRGEITLELIRPKADQPPTLIITENGIGLTEDEIHKFLATIGESSKRRIAGQRVDHFIGQFGIGLLSCFMVSDAIVVVTRSVKPGSMAMEWRGKADGTYTVKQLDADIAPGTQVYLTGKEGSEDFYDRDRLVELAQYYGGLLPYPIRMILGKSSKAINAEPPPWRKTFAKPKEQEKALLVYGKEVFGERFFDAIPLKIKAGGLDGVAYVLSSAPGANSKLKHRVYLKNMYLTDQADNLLPPWAFFVKLVVNSGSLKPTASREALQDDRTLAAAREALGDTLRRYLMDLSEREPEKLTKLIAIHDLTIKALAVADDDFFRIVFDWIPVETTEGRMTLGEYRTQHEVLRYSPTVDQFRQIAGVAAAQKICVINAGYTYMNDLLEKYPHVVPDGRAEKIEPRDVTSSFDDLDETEEAEAEGFLNVAEDILRPFRCYAEVKKFAPAELPTLFTTSEEGQFFRSVEQAKEVSNPLWSSVLDNIAPKLDGKLPFSQLCFNFNNHLLRGLLGVRNRSVLRRSVQMLYVQALLLGHHPLQARELKLLNEGLLGLIELAVENSGGKA